MESGVECIYIEKQTGTSYVYARLVLGTTGRVSCGAPIHSSVADLRAADVDVAHGAPVRQRVLAGSDAGQVPGDGLVVEGPGDGGRRGSFGSAHQGKGFTRDHHLLAEGGDDAGCAI